ncbi:MAG: C2 family cysteine protease, partial [bacterium]
AKNDNEVYVMILEKAMAKVMGSYEAIESGQSY